jgi:hypothetical protein
MSVGTTDWWMAAECMDNGVRVGQWSVSKLIYTQLTFPLKSIGILKVPKALMTAGWLYLATKCRAVSPCYKINQSIKNQ